MERDPLNDYLNVVSNILTQISSTQRENLLKASDILATCTRNDGIIHTFGVGHSHLVAEDVFGGSNAGKHSRHLRTKFDWTSGNNKVRVFRKGRRHWQNCR